MSTNNKSFNDVLQKIRNDKKTLLICVLALVGSLLLVVSEFIPEKDKTEKSATSDDSEVYLSEYRKTLETGLAETISNIDGAGSCKVMVTLDCSVEKVYAQNKNGENNTDEDKYTYNGTSEYVIIKSGTSTEEGLLLTVLEPKIRGVAVVCEGGDSYIVKTAITDTVTALFSIGGNKVSVAKMKTDREE